MLYCLYRTSTDLLILFSLCVDGIVPANRSNVKGKSSHIRTLILADLPSTQLAERRRIKRERIRLANKPTVFVFCVVVTEGRDAARPSPGVRSRPSMVADFYIHGTFSSNTTITLFVWYPY